MPSGLNGKARLYGQFSGATSQKLFPCVSYITLGWLADRRELPCQKSGVRNMIDSCLSALATAWVITLVATTGLFAALAVESVWDSTVYVGALNNVVMTDPPY